jgi:hypothetical protein
MAEASSEELTAAGQAGRQFVRDSFTAEPIARSLATLYRETVR